MPYFRRLRNGLCRRTSRRHRCEIVSIRFGTLHSLQLYSIKTAGLSCVRISYWRHFAITVNDITQRNPAGLCQIILVLHLIVLFVPRQEWNRGVAGDRRICQLWGRRSDKFIKINILIKLCWFYANNSQLFNEFVGFEGLTKNSHFWYSQITQ